MPAGIGSYSIGGVSQGCTNGLGFLSLYGVNSSEEIEIEVTLYKGTTASHTKITSYLFPGGASNAGYVFKTLSNGDYYLSYEVSGEAGTTNLFYSISCVAPPPPPPPEEPVIDCVATFSFTVAPARGPRFILEYKDNGQRTHRTEWWMKGYTGEPEHLRGKVGPAQIQYPGIGGKVGTLSGSGAVFNIIALRYGLMEEFYTTDERMFRVDHLIDGELHWRGYHMPDDYREQWLSIPFLGDIKAYDGIGALENQPYLMEGGERYYGRARAIDVVFRILRKLDLELPVWLAVNVWEDTMDLGIEPLSQSYVDQSAYYSEDNEPLSCKEVLEHILQPYGAFVKQAHAALHIIRLDETKGPYMRRRAEIGNGDSQVRFDLEAELYEEVHAIRRHGAVSYREGSQNVYSRPAFKYIAVTTEFGEYENFVFNGDFERWVEDLPMFWSGPVAVGRISDRDKFLLGFTAPRTALTGALQYIRNEAYTYDVRSEVGFTLSIDYSITIDDYVSEPGYNWIEAPYFTLEGTRLFLNNDIGFETIGQFGGAEVPFPNGDIKTDIPEVPDFARNKRIDLVYAQASGEIVYAVGLVTLNSEPDNVQSPPLNTLLVTYITWENGQPKFGSVSSFMRVDFYTPLSIGDFTARRKQRSIGGRATRNGLYSAGMDPENRRNVAYWGDSYNRGESPIFGFMVDGFASGEGYSEKSGTFTVHLDALPVPGRPVVSISNPGMNRNSLRGVTITIDNVKFTERDNGFKRMVIEGENAGHINTPPFELALHHGSSGTFENQPIMPRCEALLTLPDGSATQYWNGGRLLQEITARDLMAQHSRATLVLVATLAGPVSPISILTDLHLPGKRLLVDRHSYDTQSGLTEIEAFEVFGGAEDNTIPENAMLYEDGTPMLYESGDYMLYES